MRKNVKCVWIVGFLLSVCFTCATAQVDTNVSKKNALKIVEKEAEFPGGEKALMNFLRNKLVYPKKAVANNIQGTIRVEFVVCEDGDVCDIQIKNAANVLLAEEANRVVKSFPKWQAGEQNGKKVPSYYTLPITFELEESNGRDRKAERKARKLERKNR